MAHIVCITGGLTGMLNASLTLVDQLQQAGHQVTYASPANLREPVAAQGIPYVQLDPWVMQSGDPPMGRWQKWRTLKARQQRAVDALGVQDFAKTIKALNPDLLLIDMEMQPHIMAAVTAQLPVALLCQFLSIWQRPNLPPIHTKIVPGKGWSGSRLAINLSWWHHRWTKWLEFQRERSRRMGLDWISVLRCYAQQIGYPWQHPWRWDQWLLPYPHDELPILCFNALELDFHHDPHPVMHYGGPMVLETRQESKVKVSTDVALEAIFEQQRSGNRFLIYCACSTFVKGDRDFLHRLVTVASANPQWDLVLGLGGQLASETLSNLPENVHAFDWVPQLKILQQADCAINNGGINSINECLHFSVPMLIYSLRKFDQDGNAARMVYHGVGIAGDIAHDSPDKIANHITTLLTEPTYRERVNNMGQQCRRYAQENRAAQIVESLLTRQTVEHLTETLEIPKSTLRWGGTLR